MGKDHTKEGLAMLAGVGIGAALMYFLDPNRGNARRAQLVDQTGGQIRTARRNMETARRDLRHRLQGVGARFQSRLRDEEISDVQLSERVRAELGHHAESLRRVEVTADSGRITLSGEVAPDVHHELVSAAGHVRGVEEVQDLLTDAVQKEPHEQ